MLKFTVRRLVQLVPILLGLSILVFIWIRALPGGPAEALLGERATPEAVARMRELYGLDRPIWQQYLSYMGSVVRLDLGQSVVSRRLVTTEIRERFPATIELTVAAMIFAVGIGIPLGFLAAKRYQGPVDQLSVAGSLLGVAIPVFFLGLLLKYLFAVKLHWLPTVGRSVATSTAPHPTGFYVLDALITNDRVALVDAVRHLILPAVALGTIPLAIITRITRAAVLDVVNEDYVRTAQAKGLEPRVVDRRHVLKNAMLPVTTIIGLQTGLLLSGAVLTEHVFAWGGMGQWMYQAISYRDYSVLQAGILFLAVVFVVVNLLVDLSYALLDPRIRVR
ncbi:MAG TPA: ABC transporter permease [Actinomycetes bacterium]|nr:ABC transporter permease [Actinomycetes bacterium]